MSKRSPNIVFILADDLGWCDLGASGSTFYETPHIDSIAQGGMRFTQAYASCQVCSPTRASILTGQDTPRHGITNYLGATYGEDWRATNRFDKALPPPYAPGLQHDTTTFAEVLRRSGYRTFFAGKWHLGEDDDATPEMFGFEENQGGYRAGQPKSYFSPYQNPKLEDGPPGENLPLRLAEETAAFIEDSKDRPFLAYLSFYSVHSPLQTTKERWAKYREKALEQGDKEKKRFIMDRNLPVRQVQDHPVYAGVIEAMDDAVGIVLETLERCGLAENTIVCFTSDNGGVSSGDDFASSMLPLRGGKGRQWEGGIREPLFVRYPEMITAGSICDVPVISQDFYPTFVELAGCRVPETQVIDGVSIVGLLQGEGGDDIAQRDLFWHYPHYGNQGGDPSSMIRSGDWKLIRYHEDGHNELYNLAEDEGEQRDVSSENPEIVAQLRARLDAWLADRDAQFPSPDPLFDADKRRAYLDRQAGEGMARLEQKHARFLEAGWEPNPDWWGSAVTQD